MLRLVLLVVLFLLSLLTLFKAPAYHLWLIAIIISEFPAVVMLLVFILLFAGYWVEKFQLQGTLAGIASLALLLYPIISSYLISTRIEHVMSDKLGQASGPSIAPFKFAKLFKFGRQSHSHQRLTYATFGNQSLSLDFYPAKAEGKRPCIVIIHGGSWKSGDNKQLPELNDVLAGAGYHVAAITYRLAPKYRSPLPVEDVKAALHYLSVHSGELLVDTSETVLLGRSAGAQIALLAAYTLDHPAIKGVIDFYGPADMVWGYSAPSNPLVMNSRKVMEDYLGGTYSKVPEAYLASSPLNYVTASSVPTLIIHGENDVLVAYEHSRRLEKKLTEMGVRHYFLSLPWATHGFDYNINGPGGQLSTYAVLRFLKSVLN